MAIEVPGRGPLGRPTDLTPDRHARILELVREGHYLSTVCQANGICLNTYRSWQERGEKGEEPYLTFVTELKEAEADGELALFQRVLEGSKLPAQQGWLPALAALDRRHRSRYGQNRPFEATQQQITINILAPDGETKRLVADLVAGRRQLPQVVGSEPALQQVVEGEARELNDNDT